MRGALTTSSMLPHVGLKPYVFGASLAFVMYALDVFAPFGESLIVSLILRRVTPQRRPDKKIVIPGRKVLDPGTTQRILSGLARFITRMGRSGATYGAGKRRCTPWRRSL